MRELLHINLSIMSRSSRRLTVKSFLNFPNFLLVAFLMFWKAVAASVGVGSSEIAWYLFLSMKLFGGEVDESLVLQVFLGEAKMALQC